MKNKLTLRSAVLAAALLTGLGATAARADTGLPASAAPAGAADTTAGQGLLGQVYGNLTYSYIDLDNTSRHGDAYHFEMNQPLSFGFDGFLSYEYSDYDFGHQNTAMVGLRPFSTRFNWGKPYAEVGAGYVWATGDNSFVWEAAAGVEFQVTPKATVTPYVQYVDAPDLPGDASVWNFGAKGNYWVTDQWAVTAGAQINENHDTKFTIGTNFRF